MSCWIEAYQTRVYSFPWSDEEGNELSQKNLDWLRESKYADHPDIAFESNTSSRWVEFNTESEDREIHELFNALEDYGSFTD